MQKKQTILVVASLLLVVLSVTLAYFTAQIIGKGKNVTINSADLKIIFTDSDGSISGTNIEPGKWNVTKTFTIENKSNETYKYNIVIQDLVNTFVTNGYLQYKITSTNGGYNMTEFKDVPKSETAKDTILAYSASIDVGVTQTYTVEFIYKNDESVDQSDDMGKTLSGKLFITEGTEDIYAGYEEGTLGYQIMGDNLTRSERTDFSTPFTDTNTTNTLYKAKEDNIDVYYFAGIDGVAAHCEYNDKPIIDVSTSKLNETTCTGKIQLCHLKEGKYLYLGNSSCSWYAGTVVELEVKWIPDFSKPINNWVKFGKNASNQDLYWRIIRTNADGSVRLLYHGTSTTAKDAYIGTSKFNGTYKDSMYVGYMYGTSGSLASNRTNTNNSTIKTAIDNWYSTNMTSYAKYLSTTAVYCNDREIGSGTYTATAKSSFYYAARNRLYTNKTPTYTCTNTDDKFTVDSSTGNGKLTYPIALMTADEIVYAGGVAYESAPMWYYTNSSLESSTGDTDWFSLSPSFWDSTSSRVFFVLGHSGSFNPSPGNLVENDGVAIARVVRPVLSLKSCIKYSTGNGTYNAPYEILETDTGC